MDGTGGEQQRRNLNRLPEATEGETSWAAERGLGNAPAHRGEAVWEYLRTPGLGLVDPRFHGAGSAGIQPGLHADEAIWGWVREEATGNLCLGGKVRVQQKVSHFLARLTNRKDEVKQPCRTVLPSRAGRLVQHSQSVSGHTQNAYPTLALV